MVEGGTEGVVVESAVREVGAVGTVREGEGEDAEGMEAEGVVVAEVVGVEVVEVVAAAEGVVEEVVEGDDVGVWVRVATTLSLGYHLTVSLLLALCVAQSTLFICGIGSEMGQSSYLP